MTADDLNVSLVDGGAYLAAVVTHGREPGGRTGHVVCAQARRSLCGVEKRTPWLDLEIVEEDDEPDALPLSQWLLAGQAYVCGTCLRRLKAKTAAAGPTKSKD